MFIRYCVFSEFFNIPDSDLSLLSFGVSVCAHIRQVENQPCSRTDKFSKSQNYKEKTQYFINTLHYKCFEVVSKVL